MGLPIDTVFDVACSLHDGRWHATVAEPPVTARADDLLHVDLATPYDDIPFAVADLLAERRRFRPWRLRLLGPDLPPLFTGGRTADRTRSDHTGRWGESWTALFDGEAIIVALRSVRSL